VRVRRLSESEAGFGEACEKTLRGTQFSPPLDAEARPVGTELRYRCRFRVGS
jgi:hypothetical protein